MGTLGPVHKTTDSRRPPLRDRSVPADSAAMSRGTTYRSTRLTCPSAIGVVESLINTVNDVSKPVCTADQIALPLITDMA